jgi:lactoylglutathione lyase
MREVDQKAEELRADGYAILSGPRKTGDGYYEFETLDPDNNRIEVIALYSE